MEAALEGAKLRLRPILMTSFAFILGCVPLWTASGSGAVARRILGTVVIVGMLAATLVAIFVIPVITKLYGWRAVLEVGRAHWRQVTAISLMDIGSYMLVLITFSIASVAYAGAIREISIVFGALAGWLWLKESFGRIRVIGAIIIFAGIVTILVAG